MRPRLWGAALIGALALAAAVAAGRAADRPAVLIHSPRGLATWWVDLDYLRELHESGFEIDYTDQPEDLTWARLSRYNVLVLYNSVDHPGFFPARVHGQRDAFLELVNRFLAAGGGVLVMAQTHNGDPYLRPLIEPWGARIPLEQLRESESRLRSMPRMTGPARLALTENVLPSPVSTGVRRVWYPLFDLYNAGATSPIHVSGDWQVVLRGSPSSWTAPVDPSRTGRPAPPDAFVRPRGVQQPPLFAIREFQGGRIAFCAMWPHFSLGQGTRWLYDRRVLDKGFDGTPSDFGRLLQNTFRWLAEPSGDSDALGGHVTTAQRFVPKNLRPQVRALSREKVWKDGEHDDARRDGWKLYRGLIGARTSLSSGTGSVEQHAAAARRAGLDFVVFLEDFEELVPAELEQLRDQCRQHSDESLLLLPGYAIDDNTGSHLFFFGETVTWPPRRVRIGSRLNQQYRNPETGRPGSKTVVLEWILKGRGEHTNVGYYRFLDDPNSMKLPDLRAYGMAALRTYEGGQLLEDVTDDYLVTAQGTMPPAPVSVNLVKSPGELEAAAAGGQSLTFARARSLASLYEDALDWSNAYVSPHVFISSGPRIHAWPNTVRVWTYGAESFVTGLTRMPARLHVSAAAGLREIRIHDGAQPFRRFLPGGATDFDVVLELEGTIHRNLVVIAEDETGGRAVSFARRAWKEENNSIVFCGDRVNDCNGRLARGPGIFEALHTPPIDGGTTWDGGPAGVRPIAELQFHEPTLRSNRGEEGRRRFRNVPLIGAIDEGASSVRSPRDRAYHPEIHVGNAWSTYGPLAPVRLFRYELRSTVFARPGFGPHPTGMHGWADRRGAATSIFENTLRFEQDLAPKRLKIAQTNWADLPLKLVFGRGGAVKKSLALRPGTGKLPPRRLGTGDWLGVHADEPSNTALLWNRGAPLMVSPGAHEKAATLLFDAELEERSLGRGQTLHFELLGVVDPIDGPPGSAARFLRLARYLDAPDGLSVMRGTRRESFGLLEIQARGGGVELRVTRPAPPVAATLPVRVLGLEPRWSAGLLQVEGYHPSHYPGGSRMRYRPAAIDRGGRAHVPLFPDHAERTHVVIGHPVTSDHPELFIQVTQKTRAPRATWHVSVNNPTDAPVTASFDRAMDLPDFAFESTTRTIPAGGYVVLLD